MSNAEDNRQNVTLGETRIQRADGVWFTPWDLPRNLHRMIEGCDPFCEGVNQVCAKTFGYANEYTFHCTRQEGHVGLCVGEGGEHNGDPPWSCPLCGEVSGGENIYAGVTRCGQQEPNSGHLCTRPQGHDGNHANCAPVIHNRVEWSTSNDAVRRLETMTDYASAVRSALETAFPNTLVEESHTTPTASNWKNMKIEGNVKAWLPLGEGITREGQGDIVPVNVSLGTDGTNIQLWVGTSMKLDMRVANLLLNVVFQLCRDALAKAGVSCLSNAGDGLQFQMSPSGEPATGRKRRIRL